MEQYTTADKVAILLTFIFNIAALVCGTGTLIILFRLNKQLNKSKKRYKKSFKDIIKRNNSN